MIIFFRDLFADRTRLSVLGLLLVIGFLTSFMSSNVGASTSAEWREGWLQNFSTEVFGAFMTFILFEQILNKGQTDKAEKRRLIRQLKSSINSERVRALEELRQRRWLKNGFLSGENLAGVNLAGENLTNAKLEQANLTGAILTGATLEAVDLERSNLTGADLEQANLFGSNLTETILTEAILTKANLEFAYLGDAVLVGANLTGANLVGASLEGGDLVGAVLVNAKFNEETYLPDETKWTPETDMTRYTDPDHPDFWQPEWKSLGFKTYTAWFEAGFPKANNELGQE